MKKPFKGLITNLVKISFPIWLKEDFQDIYGPNLGYYYRCHFIDHPYFSGEEGRTSIVVKEYKRNGKKWIETLNSRYQIV